MSGARTTRPKRTLHDTASDRTDGDASAPQSAGQASRALAARRAASRRGASESHRADSSTDEAEVELRTDLSLQPQAPTSPTQRSSRAKPQQKNSKSRTNTKSPGSSPAKAKGASRKHSSDTTAPASKASKPIYSFFNAATQRQRSHGSASPVKKPSPPPSIEPEEEDLIQDDSFDEALAAHAEAATTVAHRKRKLGETQTSSSSLLQGSQKFLRTSSGRTVSNARVAPNTHQQTDNRPWVDKYGPNSVEELAVHKKKLSDIQEWLAGALQGKHRKRLLLIKGPAGAGKSTAVRLIARQLGATVREWHNPDTIQGESGSSASVTAQFQDFIGSSGKYGTLDMVSPETTTADAKQEAKSEDETQITVIEELPNAFVHSSSGPTGLRSCILQFLAANAPSMSDLFSNPHNNGGAPIVLIYSETLLNSSASVDSLTAQRLLGSEITAHPSVSVVEFNPVAPTILTKALELVIRKEARDSGRRRVPGPAVLKHLAGIGDIRNAVSALEFICLRGDDASAWSGRVAATSATKSRKSGSRDAVTLTDIERRSLEMITQRESALGIFHAVGKVVYNKREAPAATDTPPPPPPAHLAHHQRNKVPEMDVDSLLDELGTDIQTFVAALHENYALSCASPRPEQALDHLNGCIDAISDADLLCADNLSATGLYRRQFRGTSGDSLRQEELSYQTAARGLLFSLPHPVKRAAPPPAVDATMTRAAPNAGQHFGGKGDAYKMFFPASFKLWRQREEIEGLLTLLLDKAQKGELRNVADMAGRQTASAAAGGVESWKSGGASKFMSGPPSRMSTTTAGRDHGHGGDDRPPRLLMGGASAKSEMLLEQLPYIALINRRPSSNAMRSDLLRQIERVTHMTGLALPADDDDEEGGEDADGPVGNPTASLGPVALRMRKKEEDPGALVTSKEMQGLVLSDDDIEDD